MVIIHNIESNKRKYGMTEIKIKTEDHGLSLRMSANRGGLPPCCPLEDHAQFLYQSLRGYFEFLVLCLSCVLCN